METCKLGRSFLGSRFRRTLESRGSSKIPSKGHAVETRLPFISKQLSNHGRPHQAVCYHHHGHWPPGALLLPKMP
jgi:hypothetical protein